MARQRFRLGSEVANKMSGGDGPWIERGTSTEPTLDELGRKLSELRQHLELVLKGLDRAPSKGPTGDASPERVSFRCHACGRTRLAEHTGWTLRLCGDDELHPFCPECDRRHVNGDGRNGTPAEAAPQGSHHFALSGKETGKRATPDVG